MSTVQMNSFGFSFNNIIPKPTMISSSAKINPWINDSSFWGQNSKLQTTHSYKGKSMRAEKMIAITARAPNGDGYPTFPTFNGLDFAIRTLRLYERAIFVIPKAKTLAAEDERWNV
ncbi:hypothetical protein G4B88_018908 [Cannabis sativa]|uniref:Uncharacterized protein n=1 Tax=Cannabis sativa TaxID=3483 RepID=A0A7J6H0T6_CANSA|nr:hypothetical protein G4B88_018908 [Cannabis sativa]